MGILKLEITNVRNIQKQTLIPAPQFNFIFGKNASGKSALIEAIYLLGRASSYRTSSIKSVINFFCDEMVVAAKLGQTQHQASQIGIRFTNKKTEIRIDQYSIQKRADLAYAFPLQIIHPKSFELLDAGAQIRREFIDWGVFNHEDLFFSVWKKYKYALAQRNALLKAKSLDQIHVWNNELSTHGVLVNEYRAAYLKKLKPFFLSYVQQFIDLEKIDMTFISGWDAEQSLLTKLNDDIERDLRDGFTHSGPHRSDFQLFIGDRLVKDYVSRGQLKLLVICLKLAQVELIIKEKDNFGCILVDDLTSELDIENRNKVLKCLSDMHCQVFITATELNDFGDFTYLPDYKTFHVEQGQFDNVNVPRETILK
jgi:DNA replication and repair protein RecF